MILFFAHGFLQDLLPASRVTNSRVMPMRTDKLKGKLWVTLLMGHLFFQFGTRKMPITDHDEQNKDMRLFNHDEQNKDMRPFNRSLA